MSAELDFRHPGGTRGENDRGLVLVTGASGLIGGIAAKALADRYRIRTLNRRQSPHWDTVRADVADFDAMRPAFDGVHTVVHMSAALGDLPFSEFLRVNVQGVHNVLEASRQAGVKRVVLASSGAANGGAQVHEPIKMLNAWKHPDIPKVADRLRRERAAGVQAKDLSRPWPLLRHDDHTWPLGFYGWSKAAGEMLGRVFHDQFGLSIICIRIGSVLPNNIPPPARSATWISHRDIAQMIVKCVEAPQSVGYEIVYAVSDNAPRFRDIEHSRDAVGFMPQDGLLELV